MCGSLRFWSCKQWDLCIAVLTQGCTLILIDWFLQLVRYFYWINLFLTGSRRHQQPKSAKLFWEFVFLSLNSQQAIFQPAWNKHQPPHLSATWPGSLQVCHFASAGTTSLLPHASLPAWSTAVLICSWWLAEGTAGRQPCFPRAGTFCFCSVLRPYAALYFHKLCFW